MGIKEIAEIVGSEHNKYFEPVTHLKLQKILYYIKVWGIVSDTEFISDKFEKWKYGPVNKIIYNKYNKYGHNPLNLNKVDLSFLNLDQQSLLEFVLFSYGPFEAFTLSQLTHNEDPWINAKESSIISDKAINEYYSKIDFAKNFPLDFENKKYYPIKSNLLTSYLLDMNNNDKKELSTYPSFISYKNLLENEKSQLEHAG